jgi:hypothetical protein
MLPYRLMRRQLGGRMGGRKLPRAGIEITEGRRFFYLGKTVLFFLVIGAFAALTLPTWILIISSIGRAFGPRLGLDRYRLGLDWYRLKLDWHILEGDWCRLGLDWYIGH